MGPRSKLFRFDRRYLHAQPGPIAGIDEAGRGPLAGPVVAAAVVFRRLVPIPGLNDSKKLSGAIRETLFRKIICHAAVGVGRVSEALIDSLNILEATRVAMREAVLALPITPGFLLIDGPIHLDLPLPQQGIIGGDGRSASIAAASIVAKVVRDHWMESLDRNYPEYGFAEHKGYATPEHLQALERMGPSPVHRVSFRPIAQASGFDGCED